MSDFGTPIEYTVYNGATKKNFKFKPWEPLSNVRTVLTQANFMTSEDAFLYENPATKLKTVFTPQDREKEFQLGNAQPHSEAGAAFPPVPSHDVNDPIVQIVSISKSKPSFLGTQPEDGWLRQNSVMGVRCRLNPSNDEKIKENNAGMLAPVMLQNVQSANPNDPAAFTNCIITEKGAIVTFDISSWGAAGWGYNITSSMGADIAPDMMYAVYGPSGFPAYGSQSTMSLSRYVGSPSTIQMEANDALGIATKFNVQYSTLTFRAWSLSRTPLSASNLSIPVGAADATGGFQPGPPQGTGSVPHGTTTPASPKAGPPSNQKFAPGKPGPLTPNSAPNTRADGLTGSLQVFCFVFDTKEDAETVVKVLNAGTMGFG